MAGEISALLVGNVASPPELRFTPSGKAVCNITVAQTSRRFNRDSGGWVDGDTVWVRCSVWGDMAEHVAESIEKGERVIVSGTWTQRTYEKDGQKHTVNEVTVEEIGPSLRFRTVKHANPSDTRGAQPGEDPWATPEGSGYPAEPPY